MSNNEDSKLRISMIGYVGITGWTGLLLLIGYLTVKYPDIVSEKLDVILGAALSAVSMFLGKYLFRD